MFFFPAIDIQLSENQSWNTDDVNPLWATIDFLGWKVEIVAVIDIPFPAGSCFLSKQRPTIQPNRTNQPRNQPTNPETKVHFPIFRGIWIYLEICFLTIHLNSLGLFLEHTILEKNFGYFESCLQDAENRVTQLLRQEIFISSYIFL